MKVWSENHPKTRLMARKRAAILEAARDMFLRVGYDGASMEGIAAAAGVSIMTLYRHATSKDELFAAVMLGACERAHSADDAGGISLTQPLEDLLVEVGDRFQERLAEPDTISLLRTVMVETARFPQLADAAYRGFVEAWQILLDDFLAGTNDFGALAQVERRAAVANFFDDLVGTDMLRALLGLETGPVERRTGRSRLAADKLLADLRMSGHA